MRFLSLLCCILNPLSYSDLAFNRFSYIYFIILSLLIVLHSSFLGMLAKFILCKRCEAGPSSQPHPRGQRIFLPGFLALGGSPLLLVLWPISVLLFMRHFHLQCGRITCRFPLHGPPKRMLSVRGTVYIDERTRAHVCVVILLALLCKRQLSSFPS